MEGDVTTFYNQFSGHYADNVQSIIGKTWKTDSGIPIRLFYLSREKNGEWIPPTGKNWDNRLFGEDHLEQRYKDGKGGIVYKPGTQMGIIASCGNITTFLGIFEVSPASSDKCVIYERKRTECEIGKYALFKSTWLFTFDKICDKQVTKDIRGKIKIVNAKYKGEDLTFTKDGKEYKKCNSASTLIAGLANAFFENAKTEEPDEHFVNAFQCNPGRTTKTAKIKIGTRDITVNSGADLDLLIKDIATLFNNFENESSKELELEYSYCIKHDDELETMQQRKQYFENLIGGENIRLTMGNAALFRETVQAPKPVDPPYPRNCIWAGAPGTGKSYKANKDANVLLLHGETEMTDVELRQCEKLPDNHAKKKAARMERVTFHPEYSYFDFVGSYKPVMRNVPAIYVEGGISKTAKTEQGEKAKERKIEYAFVPGPFTRILVKALKDKEHPHLLLIEEINRARVAAVFGDVFQLLDRTKGGESEYSICLSEDLREYLKEQDMPLNELKLPSNLYIWATMNSADQGVYPLDTAFKRRWSMEYLDINTGEKDDDWNTIRKKINELLLKKGNVNEDKLMGYYFLKPEERANAHLEDSLKGKVLMYLFDDAAKPCRKYVFKEIKGSRTYSSLRGEMSLRKPNLGIFEGDPFWPVQPPQNGQVNGQAGVEEAGPGGNLQ